MSGTRLRQDWPHNKSAKNVEANNKQSQAGKCVVVRQRTNEERKLSGTSSTGKRCGSKGGGRCEQGRCRGDQESLHAGDWFCLLVFLRNDCQIVTMKSICKDASMSMCPVPVFNFLARTEKCQVCAHTSALVAKFARPCASCDVEAWSSKLRSRKYVDTLMT
jgi:hypothetical protein